MGIKQVNVVRKDLNMRKGKIAAQVSHGVLNVVLKTMSKQERHDLYISKGQIRIVDSDSILSKWFSTSYKKIVLYVNSEKELLDIYNRAVKKGIISTLVRDNGLTEFNKVKTYTCVSFQPLEDEIIDKITGKLPLL